LTAAAAVPVPSQNHEPPPREANDEEPGLTSAERWHRNVEAIRQRSPRLGTSLAYGRLVALRQGEVVLSFPGNAAFHRATVAGSGQAALEREVSQLLGAPTRILLDDTKNAAAGASPSLVEHEESQRAARERTVENQVRQHPAVQASIRILGGEIERIEVLEARRSPEPDAPADIGPAAEPER